MAVTGESIVVTHLTRMRGSNICVAGLGPDDINIRPLAPAPWTEAALQRKGGPFGIGVGVEIRPLRDQPPAPPEVEDVQVREDVIVRDEVPLDNLVERLSGLSSAFLTDIFGEALVPRGSTAATDEGEGDASLGYFAGPVAPELFVDGFGKLRAVIQTEDLGELHPPVTDIRLHGLSSAIVAEINAAMQTTTTVCSVGLARAFKVPGDDCARHWLQLNNIIAAPAPLLNGTPLAGRS